MITKITVNVDEETMKLFTKTQIERGLTKNALAIQCIRESLLSESKQRSIITSLSRLRGQQDSLERGMYSMYKTLERFIEIWFVMGDPVPKEDMADRVKQGQKRFQAFVSQTLKRNMENPYPEIIERQLLEEELKRGGTTPNEPQDYS